MTTEKDVLRGWAKQRRSTLDLPALSRLLVRRLAEMPAVRDARHVMLYLALPDEINIELLPNLLDGDGHERTFYVPRCAPARRLAVHPYVPGSTPLRLSAWGIREPAPDDSTEADPQNLDVVIVPALLVTPDGARLGYGGGYYDRFLPRLRRETLFISAMPQALVVPDLPNDPWDIRLHTIITDVDIFG